MFSKNFIITVLVMFLAHMTMSFGLHTSILDWQSYPGSLAPENVTAMGLPAILIGTFIWCKLFLYVFSKGYDGTGVMEGVKFGLIISVFFHFTYMLFYFANFQFPTDLLIKQFLGETTINVVIGAIAATMYKPDLN